MHSYPFAGPIAVLCLAPFAAAQTFPAVEAELLPDDVAASDWFGTAVGLVGDTVIVGSLYDDDNAGNAGSAYVYTRSGHVWTKQAKLQHLGPAGSDYFGEKLDFDGTRIVFGVPHDDEAGTNAGAVYVFTGSGVNWTQNPATPIVGSDTEASDLFGNSISLRGDVLAVGAPDNHEGGMADAGSAFIFRLINGNWIQQARLTATSPEANAEFGRAVAVGDGFVAVGSPLGDGLVGDTGRVDVFRVNDNGTPANPADDTWSHSQALSATDGAGGDRFGIAVATNGTVLAVGAHLDDLPGAYDGGSVHVYVPDPFFPTMFTPQTLLSTSEATNYDHFGEFLDFEGDRLLVGAIEEDTPATGAGAAYLFKLAGNTWTELATLRAQDTQAWDYFGGALALDPAGDFAIVGANRHDEAFADTGAAYVLQIHEGGFGRVGTGDGSVVPCPCSNDSLPGSEQGCVNSAGLGAILMPVGSASFAADDLEIYSYNLPPNVTALLFAGTNTNPQPFGDGHRISIGAVRRLGLRFASIDGIASWGPGISAIGGWPSGSTRHFQSWYRDPTGSPCTVPSGFNLSAGLTVTFAP